jgi:Zn-dependent protease with chaperone function
MAAESRLLLPGAAFLYSVRCSAGDSVWVTLWRDANSNGRVCHCAFGGSPVMSPVSILLLPIFLTIGFRWAALRAGGERQKIVWAIYRGLGRFILAVTVASWWVVWDLHGRSEIPSIVVRNWPSTLETSSAENLVFWLAPIVSLTIFLILCYTTDRTIVKQRWSSAELIWRAWWRIVSFIIPLLMVAVGFETIFDGKPWGTAWLLGAGIVAKIGTAFLRRSQGMKFNQLKSGELRNRALTMAGRMGVTLRRVYIVPAGKGHLTNAYGMSNAIGLTDNLGKYLTKSQVDYVIAHELAHVNLKHGRKHLISVLAVFSFLTLALFRFSKHALFFRPVAELAVILGPLVAIYYLSRRFEYAADRAAVGFTGEPETAIRALAKLHKIHDVPSQYDRFTELFMTHPALLDRVRAIADAQMPVGRLNGILDDVGLAEP